MTTDIKVIRGDTPAFTINFKDTAGAAVDITGAKVFFTVKASLEDADDQAKISKTITEHTDPTHGQTTVSLSAVEMAISPGNYYWDLQVILASGAILSVEHGNFIVVADVTKRTS